jgi:predicted peroxiredoxin
VRRGFLGRLPTQASFPFHHANAFAAAGHSVQIFLLGEAVTLMRTVVAASIVPVGWPPLAEVEWADKVLTE